MFLPLDSPLRKDHQPFEEPLWHEGCHPARMFLEAMAKSLDNSTSQDEHIAHAKFFRHQPEAILCQNSSVQKNNAKLRLKENREAIQ